MTAVLVSSRPGAARNVPARRPARPTARPTVRPTASTYRRRRVVAATLVAGVMTLTGFVLADGPLGPGGVPASATGAEPTFERTVIVARSGDTLWSIAREHRGDVPHGAYVDALVRLNGGASIQAGQRVTLP